MQFATYLHCQLPRVRCKEHGVSSVQPPWAGKHSRFTLLFEGFAIRVLQAARSVEEARKLLNLSWHQVNDIKARAVERGLARREATIIPFVGIDEKQFRKGHRYITNLVDLNGGRVLEVVEDRTESACNELLKKALTADQRDQVVAAAVDMWPAYTNAIEEMLPETMIVYDRFHISQHLNEAVDKVRRQENKALLEDGDDRLKGSKYLWLTNIENMEDDVRENFKRLKNADMKVSRAWALKEMLKRFWDYNYAACAKRYFDEWYAWAIRSRLEPIKEKAFMLKRHLDNMLNYFRCPISNAATEGLNSKIQTVKANARGFRSFDGFRNSILFYCGGLEMQP
jgi:transposase